jgi:predicted RNA-binding Zn-ribbon protein involved in translation (DUF1610 family)
VKVERDAILTCSACGVEGPHRLLYLSEHLSASRCANCGETNVYSGDIYAEYARDLFERTGRLPVRFLGEALRHPIRLVRWPFKAVRKPYRLFKEVSEVNSFEQARHHSRERQKTPG